MVQTFEIYTKHTSNCEGVPLTSFEQLSPMYEADEVYVRFEGEDEYKWLPVVGWTDLFGGRADMYRICWVRNGGQVGVLVHGGNSGVRILDESVNPTPGVDEHLPRGFGQPWIWIAEEAAVSDLPQEVLAVIGEKPNAEA